MNHFPLLSMNVGAHNLADSFQFCGFDATNPCWNRRPSLQKISTTYSTTFLFGTTLRVDGLEEGLSNRTVQNDAICQVLSTFMLLQANKTCNHRPPFSNHVFFFVVTLKRKGSLHIRPLGQQFILGHASSVRVGPARCVGVDTVHFERE